MVESNSNARMRTLPFCVRRERPTGCRLQPSMNEVLDSRLERQAARRDILVLGRAGGGAAARAAARRLARPRRASLAAEMAGGSTSSAIRSSSVALGARLAIARRRRRGARARRRARNSPLRSAALARGGSRSRSRGSSRRGSRRAARLVAVLAARRRRRLGLVPASSRPDPRPRRIIVALAAALLLEAGAALVEDAEIMVGDTADNIRSGRGRPASARRAPGPCIFRAAGRRCRAARLSWRLPGSGTVVRRAAAAAAAAAAPAAALTIVDQTKILTKGGSTLAPAGRALPGRLFCTTPEAGRRTRGSATSRKPPLASDQAIGGRRRQALTHPLLWSAPSLRPM